MKKILIVVIIGLICSSMISVFAPEVKADISSVSISWTAKARMPTARGSLYRGRSAIGENIYVVGGWTGTVQSTVEIYNVNQDTWTTGTSLPAPRVDGAIQMVNNKLYVMGGNSHGGGGAVSTVWEYDPTSNVWTSKAPMPTGRRSLASAVVDGKIFTISGVDGSNMISNAVEMYEPLTNTWTGKSPHPLPRQYLTAEAVNGKIYTFGGNEASDRVHEYDSVSDTWVEKSSMPLSIGAPNSVTVGDKIFSVGGDGSRTVVMYDPSGNVWSGPLDDLPTARALATTAEVNGKIYVIGGAGPAPYYDANEEGTIQWGPPIPYDVTINAHCNTEGVDVSVSITMDGTPTDYNTPHTFTGLTGSHTFTVPITDAIGHPLLEWSTGATSTTITVSSGGTYTAYYQAEYTLTITTTTGGTTSPKPGTYFYWSGTVVSVTATPSYDQLFDHWQLDGVNVGSTNPISVTMDQDHSLHAVFVYGGPSVPEFPVDGISIVAPTLAFLVALYFTLKKRNNPTQQQL